MLRSLVNSLFKEHGKVLFEVTIRKKSAQIGDDEEASQVKQVTIDCCRSIPECLPVIPWHTLVLQNESPPDDQSFVRLVSHRGDADLTSELSKFADHVNLRAILLISDASVADIPAPQQDSVPVLIIPLRHYERIKCFIKSFKSRELDVSSIPLCTAETKQKSQEFSLVCDSENMYKCLITVVRDCLRNNTVMTSATMVIDGFGGGTDRTRVLFFITNMLPEITQQATLEMVNPFTTSDHLLLINILIQRENFPKHFSQDFPVYVIFGSVLHDSLSSRFYDDCNDKYFVKMFQGFRLASIHDINKGLELFIESPNFVQDRTLLKITSVQLYISEKLIELLEYYVHLTEPQAPPVVEIFIIVSVAIKLFLSVDKLERASDLWKVQLVNVCKSRLKVVDKPFLENLKTGLIAMSTILDGLPYLMITWEDYFAVLSFNIYSPCLLKCAIDITADHMIRPLQEINFVKKFLKPMANHIQSFIGKTDNGLSQYVKHLDMTVIDVLKEIFELVQYLDNLAIQKFSKWNDDFNEVIITFSDIFISLINFKDREIVEYVIEISKKKDCRQKYLIKEVFKRFSQTKCASSMSRADFVELYEAGNLDNQKLIEDLLLCEENVPQSLRDEGVKVFIELCFSCLANSHQLKQFLFKIFERYKCKEQFILDLLVLNFQSDDIFDYIQDDLTNHLEESDDFKANIPRLCCDVMDHLPESGEFHARLLKFLFKGFEMHLDSYRCHKYEVSCNELLQNCCSILQSKTLTGLQETFSIKLLTVAATNMLTLKFEDISWLTECGESLYQIVKGYELFMERNGSQSIESCQRIKETVLKAVYNIIDCFQKEEVVIQEIIELKAQYQLLSDFSHLLLSDNVEGVSLDQIENLIYTHDLCIKTINSLLIRSPWNNRNTLQKELIIPVLQYYGLKMPDQLTESIYSHLNLGEGKNVRICFTENPQERLKDLKDLAMEISEVLYPIEQSLDAMVFFAKSTPTCLFFQRLLQQYKNTSEMFSNVCSERPLFIDCEKLSNFNTIIQTVEKSYISLLEGAWSFSMVLNIMSLEELRDNELMESEVFTGELYLRSKFTKATPSISLMKDGLRALVTLFDNYRSLSIIYDVCNIYRMDACLTDPKMIELRKIVETMSNKHLQDSFSLVDGIQKVSLIKSYLGIEDIEDSPLFQLVLTVSKSSGLHKFCVNRGFISTNGYQRFEAEYNLVVVGMDKEDYCEEILDQLRGAMVFVSPFLKTESSFSVLVDQLSKLINISAGIRQINAVEKNIDMLDASFNTVEGETHDLIMNTLESILDTGEIMFNSVSTGDHVEVLLKFHALSQSDNEHWLKWNLERLNIFSRKLTFLNAEKKGAYVEDEDEDIAYFNMCLDHVKTLLQNYRSLQKLGWKVTMREFSLNKIYSTQMQVEVDSTVKKLHQLSLIIENVRAEYKPLSLVSSAKMKILHEKIISKCFVVNTFIDDLGMFFNSNFDENVCEKMKLTIEDILNHTNHPSHDYYNISFEKMGFDSTRASSLESSGNSDSKLTDHPVDVVGRFLDQFLSIEQYQGNLVLTEVDLQQEGYEFNLYTALDYSNMEVVCLIFWIFKNRFPYSFQLLQCTSSTCEEELRLFFQRISHYPKFLYLILGINRLTMELQQTLITLCSDIKNTFLKNDHGLKVPNVCFVEFKASVFQTLPWMKVQNVVTSEIPSRKHVEEFCQNNFGYRFRSYRIIHGMPGYGKTHFIEKQLQSNFHTSYKMFNIDEDFNKQCFIGNLKNYLSQGTRNSALFLNVNLIFNKSTQDSFNILADQVNWFFFEYFFLGYVEDYETGLSLRFPDGMETSIYIEVPFWSIEKPNEHSDEQKLRNSFSKFCEFFPAFCLFGKREIFEPQLAISPGIILTCKYLRRKKEGRLDRTILPGNKNPIKFGEDPTVAKKECARLLDEQTPVEIKHNKLLEKLHWKYLERRCYFMENCPQLMFNSGYCNRQGINTKQMRSTLFEIMLDEVQNLCKTSIHWKNHSQLIYDFTNSDASFHFLSYDPSTLSTEKKEKLTKIGVKLTKAMANRNKQLHKYLSIAFGVKLNEDGELTALMDAKYVLTKDFTLKMLNINERKECEMPVIIEGETGVGKTYLVEMLSKLWNESWKQHINLQKSHIQDLVSSLMTDVDDSHKKAVIDSSFNLAELNSLSIDQWVTILTLEVKDKTMLFKKMRPKLQFCWHDPCLVCLELPSGDPKETSHQLWEFFELYDEHPSPSYLAYILYFIFRGELKSCFYKLNLHSAVTPKRIMEFFKEILLFANSILRKHEMASNKKKSLTKYHRPIITVFLDEINTSTCPGFLKQIIVDHTLNHRKMPENIFIVAACNPYRGNNHLSSITATEHAVGSNNQNGEWFKSSYYVQPLAPSLELLKWDYGFLKDNNGEGDSEEQADESEYVNEKMRLNYYHKSGNFRPSGSVHVSKELEFLSERILKSQNFIRRCASEQLKSKVGEKLAKQYATSCVSQRDVQRVFVIYDWLINWFKYNCKYDDDEFTSKVRAIFVSIGIVYYFRLDLHNRVKFEKEMSQSGISLGSGIRISFTEALQSELDYMISKFTLPPRIAPTQALKENIYATVVCVLNHIPLIIVGPPGSSKTLSFNIVRSHLKGRNSFSDFFKDEEMFPPVDIHSYQCSSRSTSTEIESVFKAAIRRKKLMDDVGIRSCAVVLMDEAGLAEESHESLKVLHYYLDNRSEFKVSFVALSNHVLDAAKTNRAISLYRSPSDLADMRKIAEKLFPKDEKETVGDVVELFIQQFLNFYESTKAFRESYGIRDVVHFLLYLYRRKEHLSPDIVVEALERNFNGNKDVLDGLVQASYQKMTVDSRNFTRNKDFVVFKNSLADRPPDLSVENQVRYKLVIDSSRDESLIGMFFAFNILERQATNVLVCTKFPGDLDYEKINTIAALRYSAANGRVVALISCEEIQESFYDIFNQNFASVELQKGTKYFGNIAIGARMKMCFVDPKFQCVVFLKESKLKTTPAPYLNRFEKYKLTHNSVLEETLMSIPKRIQSLIETVRSEIEKTVVERFKEDSCFGFCESTIDSLILSVLACEQYSVNCCILRTAGQEGKDSKLHLLLKEIIIHLTEEHPRLFYFEVDCSTFDDDVNFIDIVLRKREELYNTLEDIGLDQIGEVVSESLKWLRSEDKEIECYKTDETELVSFCIKEWLQLYICKKLLCIMKPEALIIRACVPYEKRVYLKQQHHFSLSSLIGSTLAKAKSFDEFQRSSIAGSKPNRKWTVKKSIYHTRSTYLVQQVLPLYYSWQEYYLSEELKQKFETFFKSEIDCICAITLASTSNDIQHKLKNFLTDDTSVFLLVVDMKAVDSEVVNHIRIMISELEYRLSNKIKTTKILSLLLHYPLGTSRSSHFVYPAIFLHDWDHFYLDDIETSVIGNIDMVGWLSECCLDDGSLPFITEETLDYWIDENLPIISSLNVKPENFEWPSMIKEAKDLWNTFLSKRIRKILGERFMSYWSHEEIISTSNRVAVQCGMKLSSSMIDSINEQIKQVFNDYLMYFLSLINDHHGVYIMFSNDDPEDQSKQLLVNLLTTIPLPRTVDQFKAALHDSEREEQNFYQTQPSQQILRFPFFNFIFDLLDCILDESMNIVHEEFKTRLARKKTLQLTGSDMMYAFTRKQLIRACAIEQMTKKLEQEAKTSTSLNDVLSRLKTSTVLWEKYLNCVISRRLNAESSIGSRLLSKYFTTKYKMDAINNMEGTLCSLHVNLRLDDMNSYGNGVVFLVRCVDELSCLCNNVMCFEEMFTSVAEDQDLEDFVFFVSRVIKSAFTVFCDLLNADHMDFEKLSSFLNIYDGIVIWIKTEEIFFKLEPKTINFLILMTMFFKMVYFSVPMWSNTEQDDILQTVIGEPTCTLKVFVSSYHDFISHKANQDSTMKLWNIVDEVIKMLLGDTNVSLLMSQGSLPLALFHSLDFLLDFYVVETRLVYFDEESFHWFLDLCSVNHRDTKLSGILINYLHQILLQDGKEEKASPLRICNSEYRRKLSMYFSRHQYTSTKYLPIYYKDCPRIKKNVDHFNGTLADAYFQLIVQQLISNDVLISTLISLHETLTNSVKDCTLDNGECLLVSIEREAVTNAACTKLATIIVKNDYLQLEKVTEHIPNVNCMLNAEHLSIVTADKINGHGILFVLRLLQAYNSPNLLCHHMWSNFELKFESFKCLKPVIDRRFMQPADFNPALPLLAFSQEIYGKKSSNLYREISSRIGVILNSQSETEALDKLAFQWCIRHSIDETKSEHDKRLFMMLLFLSIYDILFKEKKTFEYLAKHIHKSLSQYLPNEYVGLMVWFADQGYFKKHFPESTQSFNNAAKYLMKLRDDENTSLLKFLIQLLAITIGSSKSTHLWTLLFNPASINAPFPTLVGDEKCFISSDSFVSFKNLGYIESRNFNYQSFSLIYTVNFSALALSFLAKHTIQNIFNEKFTFTFFIENVERMWNNQLLQILYVNQDEKDEMMNNFLFEFYKTVSCIASEKIMVTNYHENVFKYEKTIHEFFASVWGKRKIQSRYVKQCRLLAETLRTLESKTLPIQFDEDMISNSFLHKILSSTDINNPSNRLYILYQTLLNRCTLNMRGRLLPHLIYMYRFIHDRWSYLLTKEEANERDVEHLLTDYLSECSLDSRDVTKSRFNELTTKYSEYVQVSGARAFPTKVADLVTNGEKGGFLYETICTIVEEYNSFIRKLENKSSGIHKLYFKHKSLRPLPLSEVTSSTCCIGESLRLKDLSDLMPVLLKHLVLFPSSNPPKELDQTLLPNYMSEYFFDLKQIQFEIMYILSQKKLVDLGNFKRNFKFLGSEKQQVAKPNNKSGTITSMDLMRHYLKNHPEYSLPLPTEIKTDFISLFHSLHYNAMQKVLIGLRLLVKRLSQLLHNQLIDVRKHSVKDFIDMCFTSNRGVQDGNFLKLVGIEKHSPTHVYSGIKDEQYFYLCELRMKYVFSIVDLLANWIDVELYHYRNLPCSMKAELGPTLAQEIYYRIEHIGGGDSKAITQKLLDLLLENETNIQHLVHRDTEMPLSKAFKHEEICKGVFIDELLDGLQIKNYVYAIIQLKSILGDFLVISSQTIVVTEAQKTKNDSSNAQADVQSNDNNKGKKNLPPISELSRADKKKMEEKAHSMSDDEFLSFIESVGLSPETISLISEYSVTAAVLYNAIDDDDQLVELEITKACLRLKLRVLFKRFLLGRTSRIAQVFTCDKIIEFIQRHPKLSSFVKVLEEFKMDGEILWLADDEALKELGITGLKKNSLKTNFEKEVQLALET